MIDIGSLGITDMRVGTSEVLSGYVGTTLIYPVAPPQPSYEFYDYIAPTGTTYTSNYIALSGVSCTTTFSANVKHRLLANVGGIYFGFNHTSDSSDYRVFYIGRIYFDFNSSRVNVRVSILNTDCDWYVYNYGIDDNITGTHILAGTTQSNAPQLNEYRINPGVGRIYRVELFESGTKIKDLKPALRLSDSVAGLYDEISGVFYTAQNPGDIGAYNIT